MVKKLNISANNTADTEDATKEEEHRLLGVIPNTYKDFAKSTSAHGFHWTIESSSFIRKLLWSLVVLVFVITAIITSIRISCEFIFGSGATTEVNIVHHRFPEENIPLPDVIVCDPMPWDVKKAEKQNISADLLSYIAYFIHPTHRGMNFETAMKENNLELQYQTALKKFNQNVPDLLDSVTRTCEDTIVWCQENGGKELKAEDCCKNLFDKGVYQLGGKCYSTRGKLNATTNIAAKIYGLTVAFILNEDVSFKLNLGIAPFWSITTRGLGVGLLTKVDNIFKVMMSKMMWVAPDTFSEISAKKTEMDMSSVAESYLHYKECVNEGDEKYLHMVPGYDFYTNENCGLSSFQGNIVKNLNCSVLYFPPVDGVPFCTPMQTMTALKQTTESVSAKKEFRDHCPMDCVKKSFETKLSSSKLSDGVKKMFRMAEPNFKKDFEGGIFSVYYSDLDYVQTVQHTKTIKETMAAIGGNLGLYIGASFVTLLEFIISLQHLVISFVRDLVIKTH